MFNTRQTILASRPAAMVLALTLVAGLSAPFLLLPRVHAADDPPLPCTAGNYNGCTELSPTPPQDTVSVPPNLVLMLDDSGSMDFDYMPDWEFLSDTGQWGRRNPNVNGVYYNPMTTYTPPPKADGTPYPDSPGLTDAYFDGFTDTSDLRDVRTYYASDAADFGHQYRFGNNLPTTQFNPDVDRGPAVWGGGSPGSPGGTVPAHCSGGAGYYRDPDDSSQCIRDPIPSTEKYTCDRPNTDWGPGMHDSNPHMCRQRVRTESGWVVTWYEATDAGPQCTSGTLKPDGKCHFLPKPWVPEHTTPPTDPVPDHWTCPSGGSTDADAPPPPSDPPECKSGGSRIYVWAFVYVLGTPVAANAHFVVREPKAGDPPDAIADGWCSVLYYPWEKARCLSEGDTSGTAAPDGVTAGQNIANWFSYYRTRMLMSKTGLMKAFTKLDPKYRFGFASINATGVARIPTDPAPFAFDDYFSDPVTGNSGGSSTNKLAVVQPFGEGSDSTSQKAKFWDWLANETPNNATPLRKALDAVGQYYKTDQPWTSMPGDPGYPSDTKFACRASYTILMTDGFWNGAAPTGIGYAAGSDGPVQTVPADHVTQYLAKPPFSGGGVGGDEPSLADVATYYWENDLQTAIANEGKASDDDRASWQHMTTFTIGLGFDPPVGPQPDGTNGIMPAGTTLPQIFAWAHDVDNPAADDPTLAITGFSWPTPSAADNGSIYNIADLAHAAVNGHGAFFNAKKPDDLVTAFLLALEHIAARTVDPTPAAVNASVLSLGAVSFSTGYSTGDWSGAFQAVTLKTDGTVDQILWKAGDLLNTAYHSSSYTGRNVYTGSYTAAGGFTAFQLTDTATLDSTEQLGLQSPALSATDADDTLAHRIDYVLGDNTYEISGLYRPRTNILGAILRSQPVYVAGATGNYSNIWPATAPESAPAPTQTFDAFVTQQASQPGMVYVGANDGMLHAFHAPVPTCSSAAFDADGNCSVAYTVPAGSGTEAWAFVPRAVYANLGNLTSLADFHFRPTVDATPVRRDVFFSGDKKWHTILAGGVGLGGRGVYALDITDPATFSASDVLWEFDSDMTIPASDDCKSIQGSSSDSVGCRATDLGYTVSKPNIGRLANGKWVVLVANGYFPDCTTPDFPTADIDSCKAIAAQAPLDSDGKPYSSLFVLDAETGKAIAELKTPTNISGVTSFSLATPVMGDYDSDQIDDVAFAGDVQGNLWRFDLSDASPTNWTVTLVYKGMTVDDHQGVQPITTMPRLFPDPVTNRFMVLFGTGKFLGVGDNGNATVQGIYGVRDVTGTTYDQGDLQQQYLHETVEPALLPDGTPNPLAGATLRCVTGSSDNDCSASATAVNAVAADKGGWFINLQTTTSEDVVNDAGERVVVDPGAIFASNTVVIETLITGSESTDACNPTTVGAIMALNANTGGPSGVSSLGGWPIAGGRISNARTSGSLPVVSALGGGQAYLPGAILAPLTTPMGIDAPIWRRRSWQEIRQNP